MQYMGYKVSLHIQLLLGMRENIIQNISILHILSAITQLYGYT